jgi:hypothetical protein
MSTPVLRALAPVAALCALAACGDDGPTTPEFLSQPGAALTLDPSLRGINMQALNSLFGNADLFLERDAAVANDVVIEGQAYSEFAQTQSQDRRAPRISEQVARIVEDDRVGPFVDSAATRYLVVDLQRLDREWLVDWEGLARDEADVREQSLTFQIRADEHGSDLQADLTEYVLDALDEADGAIDALILGTEMDRWYASSPGDWPYFVDWVRATRDAAVAAQPGIRVAVGLNWSTFMTNVVPRFAESGVVDYVAVETAWNAVIGPLYWDEAGQRTLLDFYAFASIPDPAAFGGDPDQIPWEHYAGIETFLDREPAQALPVAWFALGWPQNGDAPEPASRFLTRFLSFNGGYDVELVSWRGWVHLGNAECTKYVEVGAPASSCFAGLYPSVPIFTETSPLQAAFFGR